MMIGWKLDPEERMHLLARFQPLYADVVADHITLRSGSRNEIPLPQETVGEIIGEIDDGAGVQALVVCIAGTSDRGDGRTYHITWSIDRARGRRPVESNAVIAERGWQLLAGPIPIRLRPARF